MPAGKRDRVRNRAREREGEKYNFTFCEKPIKVQFFEVASNFI